MCGVAAGGGGARLEDAFYAFFDGVWPCHWKGEGIGLGVLFGEVVKCGGVVVSVRTLFECSASTVEFGSVLSSAGQPMTDQGLRPVESPGDLYE